jgi:hypothetical protein
MKVPQEYLGKLVAIQLARPTYVFDYAAHVKLLDNEGFLREELMLQPLMVPAVSPQEASSLMVSGQPVPMRESTREVLTAVQVVAVADDSITVEMMIPNESGTSIRQVRKLIPSGLILAIDHMVTFEGAPPQVTQHREAAAPPATKVTLK